ncbi:RNA helicase [Dimargaris verticillata]|uniref:RNA helicase n=1 Tax=Dimargaris verticillata TaxID=2761393 RepID=A0A9W8EEW9_9FUNG|nr:RNA helicase [Dimargaris verticillata]
MAFLKASSRKALPHILATPTQLAGPRLFPAGACRPSLCPSFHTTCAANRGKSARPNRRHTNEHREHRPKDSTNKLPLGLQWRAAYPPQVYIATEKRVKAQCVDILKNLFHTRILKLLKPLHIDRQVIEEHYPIFCTRYLQNNIPELEWTKLGPIMETQDMGVVINRVARAFTNQLLNATPRIPREQLGELPLLKQLASLEHPQEWFPRARRLARRIIMHVGPTNSGKTHHALQRLEQARKGIYCGPLRLLAHEIYSRMNRKGIGCDLITGEDRRISDREVPLTSSTVEMINFSQLYDVAVVDEIQVISDVHRGYAWTNALLGLQAREVHLCGEPSAVPLVKRLMQVLGDTVEVVEYDRLSGLEVAPTSLQSDLTNLRRGDCVVAFSRSHIYELKQFIELRTRHKCAVIYGGLPPETRAQQAELFNTRDNDYNVLVASDAIGMGINLNIGRIIFSAADKFNGAHRAELPLSLTRQIAGRAGRYGTEFNPGMVTAVLENDMTFLRKMLPRLPPVIDQAQLIPPLELIERFSYQLPNAPFTTVMQLFDILAELGPVFSLGEFAAPRPSIKILDDLPLSIADKYVMSFAPLVDRNEFGLKICSLMVSAHAYGLECKIDDIFNLPSGPIVSVDELEKLENDHRCLMAYLWLSYKFPGTYVEQQGAKNAKARCERIIEASLLKARGQKPSSRKPSAAFSQPTQLRQKSAVVA